MTFDYPQPRFKRMLHELLDRHNGLMACLLMQALEQYSVAVTELDPNQVTRDTNGFVNGHAWIACARSRARSARRLQGAGNGGSGRRLNHGRRRS